MTVWAAGQRRRRSSRPTESTAAASQHEDAKQRDTAPRGIGCIRDRWRRARHDPIDRHRCPRAPLHQFAGPATEGRRRLRQVVSEWNDTAWSRAAKCSRRIIADAWHGS